MTLRSLLFSSLVIVAGCAAEPRPTVAAPPPKTTSAELKPAGEATIGDRTSCPTSGEEFVVTADSPKVEYQGKTYYFCCSGCDKKFSKDPEKYLKKAPGA